ncbi:hypothetical protein WDL1P2_00003 (plasmid) [Variovorax sp. WDL1]|nr:hypothetical protein CHC06_06673 [Variovorax sp. B2]PNG49412.1 hypothetical protein CHC07_06321 [Variovorax sp. B4]VTV18281.1 hypothetical protein WDL1P2_00003 [Variovorax sp. WDL1]
MAQIAPAGHPPSPAYPADHPACRAAESAGQDSRKRKITAMHKEVVEVLRESRAVHGSKGSRVESPGDNSAPEESG